MLHNAMRAAVLALPILISSEGAGLAHEDDVVFLQFEFGEYRFPEPAWAAGGISCQGGQRIVFKRGFDVVNPLECHGRTFTYTGWWHGDIFRIFVDSASGRIIGVGPA
jgi:hypothetical protein